MPTPKRQKLLGDEANFRSLFQQYKKSAKKRKHAFEISEATFRELTKGKCYICGTPPTAEYRHSLKRSNLKVPYVYNGIDRLENTEGYIEGNVITCCGKCNRAKGKMSIEEFLLYLYDAYNHSIKPALNEGVPNDEYES